MIRKWMVATCMFAVLQAFAAEKYSDPDAPSVHTSAKQALKGARILPISGKVLDIVGVTRGITGLVKELGGKITATQVKLELSADVLFDFNKADLRSEAVPTLEKVAQVIKNYAGTPVLIEGHTDSIGADDYNLKLSERRAQSVSAWLQNRGGIEAKRISIKGLGETKPVAPNTKPDGSDNPDGRQKNRRVEITIRTK